MECPAPFVQNGSSCLYLETDPGKFTTWANARTACTNYGGHLAILDTQERQYDAEQLVMMNYFIFSYPGKLNPNTGPKNYIHIHNLR